VITTQTEHKCVLDSCRQLEAEGFEVTYLPVQTNGLIDLEHFESSIKPTTSLVSVMTVRNLKYSALLFAGEANWCFLLLVH